MRLGRERDAHGYWKQALRCNRHFAPARDNLKDLKKPVGERHAPWPFQIESWIAPSIVEAMIARLARSVRLGDDSAVEREMRQFLREHAQVAALIPMLLDRGDPAGREFAVKLAMLAEAPELTAALKDFALGQRGPDDSRHAAARFLEERGALPAGPTRFWIRGKWRDVLLLTFEIHNQPTPVHQPRVEELGIRALRALHADRAAEAESLLKQALETEPDAPDLLNNLASAYRLQGRDDEWRRIIHDLHQRHPDYLFARIAMSTDYLDARDCDKAREMLHPLLRRRRYHITEFTALCQAEIALCLAEGQTDGAQTWHGLWEDAAPDDAELERWRARIALARLSRWLRRRPLSI